MTQRIPVRSGRTCLVLETNARAADGTFTINVQGSKERPNCKYRVWCVMTLNRRKAWIESSINQVSYNATYVGKTDT
jgi:hypothetical protein